MVQLCVSLSVGRAAWEFLCTHPVYPMYLYALATTFPGTMGSVFLSR